MGENKKLGPLDASPSVTANRIRPLKVNGREGALKWNGGRGGGGQRGVVDGGVICSIV